MTMPLKRVVKEMPTVSTLHYQQTVELLKFFEDKNKLLTYYKRAKVKDGKINKKAVYIPKNGLEKIKMRIARQKQFDHMLKTGKHQNLIPYPSNNKYNESECDIVKNLTLSINSYLATDIKKELKLHHLKQSGNKTEIWKRLKTHYKNHK